MAKVAHREQARKVFHFDNAPLFERLSSEIPYHERYASTDLPVSERKPKRALKLCQTCPFNTETLRELSELVQGDEAWRDWRNCFITSSRFGVAAAEHPQSWEKAMDFWRESTGRVPAKIFGEVQQGYLGHGKRYEPVARSVYERLTGCGPLAEEGMRIEMRAPYVYSASPDGVGHDRLIEIKCKAVGRAVSAPPYYYLPQIIGAAVIYDKPFSDFVGYWARPNMEERLMYCARVHTDKKYWKSLRLRLDYMAWCVVHDVPPTAAILLKTMYPLPEVRIEDHFYYYGATAALDDDPTAALLDDSNVAQ